MRKFEEAEFAIDQNSKEAFISMCLGMDAPLEIATVSLFTEKCLFYAYTIYMWTCFKKFI